MGLLMRRRQAGWPGQLIIAAGLVAALAACEHVSSREIGAGMGSITGALIGSQFGSGASRVTTTAFGAFAGGIVGAELGGRMDERERALPDESYGDEEEWGGAARAETVGWEDPDAAEGDESAATVGEDGRVCREFRQELDVKGHRTIGYGRACRNAEGVWEIEDSRT